MKNQDQTSMTQRLSASQASMLVTGFFVVTLDLLFLIFYLPKIIQINAKLYFIVFTAIFLMLTSISTSVASNYSQVLQSRSKYHGPRDAVKIYLHSQLNEDLEIAKLGRRYWRWSLASFFCAGGMFSWLGFMFYIFILA